MKHSEAFDHLQKVSRSQQKMRSNLDETFQGDVSKAVVAGLVPWITGQQGAEFLYTVQFRLDQVERKTNPRPLQPYEFYNVMTLLYAYMPHLVRLAALVGWDPFPTPDELADVLTRGWEPE